MKKILFCMLILSFIVGCTSMNEDIVEDRVVKHEVTIEVISGENTDKVVLKEGDKVIRSMKIRKDGYELSQLSAVYGNKLYIKLFSGLSIGDVTMAWTDLIIMENEHPDVDEVHIFIDSPGGDAFSGLALADQIEKYQKKNVKFVAHATGIVASAAVPIFAVCDETHATEATIFMVHEAALWKWPGRETASDIRSQGALMDLLQTLYINKLLRNSKEYDSEGKKIDFDYWVSLEAKTSWFDVNRAKELGILDFIN